MTIRDELLAIKGNKELLDAKEAHEWAEQHQDSEIYKGLEWNNNKAGYEYRIWQIRRLIAIHIVVVPGERKFISLSVDRVKGGGYRDLDQIVAKPKLEAIMIADALSEIERVVDRFRHIRKLSNIWSYLDEEITKYRNRSRRKPRKAA